MLFEGFILQTFTFLSDIIDHDLSLFIKTSISFRDCRQDHKYPLKGCFVCESFKHWQVSKTCIIWIVHAELSQLLLNKSSPVCISRPVIKPNSAQFSQKQKEESQESGSYVWRVSVSHKNNHPTCTGKEKKASIWDFFILFIDIERKSPSFVLYASRTVSHHICLL